MASTQHRPTERVLDILELLSDHSEGMTLTELSRTMDAPKSSLLPLLHTMTDRKFIYINTQTGKYSVGVAAYSVGAAFSNNINTLQLIQSEMKYIVSQCGETCQLGIQNRSNLLYIAKVDSPEPLRLISHVGTQLPLYCTAIGRAILAEKSNEDVRALFPDGMSALTEHTITDWETLFKELEDTRRRGYAIEHEETTLYIHCMGVPLCYDGKPIAAISVSIPTFRFTDEKKKDAINLLQTARNKLEQTFLTGNVDLEAIK